MTTLTRIKYAVVVAVSILLFTVQSTIALDIISGSSSSSGTLTPPLTITAPDASIGSELALAINSSNWSVNQGGTGWASPVAGGVLDKNADGTGDTQPSVSLTPTIGVTYRVSVTLNAYTSGTIVWTFGGVPNKSTLNSATTFTDYVTALTTGSFFLAGSNTSRFTISAISIKRWDQNTGTGVLDGLMTLKNGLYLQGGSIGLGTAPHSNSGLYAQWDSGPAITLEAGASKASGGVKSTGNQPVMAVKCSYNSNQICTVVNGNGSIFTVSYVVISGRFASTMDSTGKYTNTVAGGTAIPSMLELTPDVTHTAVIRPSNDTQALTLIDNGTLLTDPYNRHYILDSGGQMWWAPPATGNLVTGRPVASLAITSAGTSCSTTTPTITLSGGGCTTQGTGSATASGGVLQTITLVTPGKGCTSNPTVTVGNSCTGTVAAALVDTGLGRGNIGQLVLGVGDRTAVPVGNTLRGPNATGTDIAGVDTTIGASLGTGTGTTGKVVLSAAAVVQASGTTQHTTVPHITLGGGSVAVNGTLGAEKAPALTAGNWTVGAGWESPIVGPGLIKNADGIGTATPSSTMTIVAGNVYKVIITTSAFSVGSFTYKLGNTTGVAAVSTATTTTEYIHATDTSELILTPTSTSRFTVSAISVTLVSAGALTVDGLSTFRSPMNISASLLVGQVAVGSDLSPGGIQVRAPIIISGKTSASVASLPLIFTGNTGTRSGAVSSGWLNASNHLELSVQSVAKLNFTTTTATFTVPVVTTASTIQTTCVAIASLPAGITGARACVNDQVTACPVLGGTFTAGGALVCSAFYNGTAWVHE